MSNAPIVQVQCIACDRTLQTIKHNPANFLVMMKNASGRRVRTPNWSLQEKQYLLELIKEKKNIVVPSNISTGSNHSEEKTAAWNDIMRRLTEKFGSKFAGSTIKKVKTQWQNMKRIAREEFSARVVSQQSMEVCTILDGEVTGDVMKDEDDDDASIGMEIKQEDLFDLQYTDDTAMTIDLPSEKIASPPKRSSTKKASPTASSVLSEYIHYSETDDPQPAVIHSRQENASQTSSNPETVPNLSPDNAVFNRAREDDSRRNGKNTATEIKLKTEMMKEERQVLRAMRETAELNKVIAEQRLKHILWIKKQDQA